MVGETILHYKIIEKIGAGGMGVVYKAEDTRLDRVVALKFLPTNQTATPEEKERFVHEAKSASSLDHPNICTVYEINETNLGEMFIAMACYEGESLKEKIDKNPVSLKESVTIIRQICNGLSAAHKKGIVHRDIKPANIFITSDGVVKILDFGLAKSEKNTLLTQVGTTLGTSAYKSPEQTKGDEVDARTDIWSLGVIMFEMLSGVRPFKGEYELAVVYSIMNMEPEYPDSIDANIKTVIEKCLVKDRDKRYENTEKIIEDLSDFSGESRIIKSQEKPAAKKKQSIAVLPFRNMSADPEQEFFCEGIAEELIDRLTKLKNLKVAARTSSFYYKNKDMRITEIGKELGVGSILEGSLRKAGNKIRITAKLVNVGDGYHIWSDKYDRELDDIFEIQDEISLAIVDQLEIKLLGREKSKLIKKHTANTEAHEYYLKGIYFWNKRYEGGLEKSIESFNKALEIDPDYAVVLAYLSNIYTVLGEWGFQDHKVLFPKAMEYAGRSLELDPALAEGHTAIGFLNMIYKRDFKLAKKHLRKAVDINPDLALSHAWYGIYYTLEENKDMVDLHMQKAIDLEPLNPMIISLKGIASFFLGDYDTALLYFNRSLELSDKLWIGYHYKGVIEKIKGNYDAAIENLNKALELSGGLSLCKCELGIAYAKMGNKKEALTILENVKKERPLHFVTGLLLAELGEIDEAVHNFEKSVGENEGFIVFLKGSLTDPDIVNDERLKRIYKKIGLDALPI